MRVTLTDRSLPKLAAPARGQIDYFDKTVPGFGLRVSANGARSWIVLYRRHGRKQRVTLGPEDALSLAEARAKAKDMLARVRLGEDPAAERRAEREAATFSKLADEYLRLHAAKKRSGKEDARILRKYAPTTWRHSPARDITRRQVRDLLDGIAERAPIQANRVLACLRKVFNFGIDRELVEVNPCVRVARPAAERQRDRVLSTEELRRLWKALADAGSTQVILKLMLFTAQRGGEVKAMRWEDVDLEAGWWTVPTVATFLTSELGVSRLVVSKLLNHVETGVTKVYDRASYDREKQAALNSWAVKLEQIVSGESARAKIVPLRA